MESDSTPQDTMTTPESFTEYQERLAQEAAGQTKEDVLRETHGIDLDNIPKQDHRFVDRGMWIVCEGANHPSHRHWRR